MFKEAQRIRFQLGLRGYGEEERKIKGCELASNELKSFIVEEDWQEGWSWEDIVRRTEEKWRFFKNEEEGKFIREQGLSIIRDEVVKVVRSQMRRISGKSIRCYKCYKEGHIARDCTQERNKNFTDYLFFSKSKNSLEGGENVKKRKLNCQEVEEEKQRMIKEFDDLFRHGKVIEFCKIEKCEIKTKGPESVVKRGQTIPQALRNKTREYLEDLEKRKVIRRSNSQWRNLIRALEKPNGDVRVVSNFMALNDLVEKDPYELANIRDVIRETEGARWFSVINLKEGFYHIEIEEEDKKKTPFEGRVFEWNSMVMGCKNSPQILQRVKNTILDERRGNGVGIYMADVVVYGRSSQIHDDNLRWGLNRLKDSKMRVKQTNSNNLR